MFLEDMSKAIHITEKAVVRDESVTRIVFAAEICLRPGCHHDIVAELSSRSLLDPTGEGGGLPLSSLHAEPWYDLKPYQVGYPYPYGHPLLIFPCKQALNQ